MPDSHSSIFQHEVGTILGEVRLGQVVSSRAGRDRGKLFVIVSLVDGASVGIADGAARTIDRPKRKNLRHLTVHPIVARELSERLASGGRPSNQELRRYLSALSDARQAQPKEGDSADGEAGCH